MTSRNGPVDTGRVLREHRELRKRIEDLKSFLGDPRPDVGKSGAHTWASTLAERLLELHGKIFRHFREEERSGLMTEIRQTSPSGETAAEMLQSDHDRILSELRTILASVMVYSEGRPPDSPNLRRWTMCLLEELARHEEEEMTLIQEHFYRDFGGPGPG